MGFVDLTCIPASEKISFGGLQKVTPGLYAIVECAKEEANTVTLEIFTYVEKEVGQNTPNNGYLRKFYLADVEAIVSTLAVIPDIGGKPNAYFTLKPREKWQKDFESWLEEVHEEQIFSDEEQ